MSFRISTTVSLASLLVALAWMQPITAAALAAPDAGTVETIDTLAQADTAAGGAGDDDPGGVSSGDAEGGVTSDADRDADQNADQGVGDGAATVDGTRRAPDGGERGAWARLGDTVTGLEGTERLVLGAAVALPLLLLLAWAATRTMQGRGRRDGERSLAGHGVAPTDRAASLGHVAPIDRVAPPPRRTSPTPALEPRSHDLALEPRSHDLAAERHPIAERGSVQEHDVMAEHGFIDENDLVAGPDDGAEHVGPRRGVVGDAAAGGDAGAVGDIAPRSSFGEWLLRQEAPSRRRHAIELLIYWMAYGDERYDPAVKAVLLTSDPAGDDDHDRVKRAAFEQDTLAFADTVGWLQRHASEPQRVQIVDLLMALLVDENAMSPLQDTMLRFLADAFGLGPEALGERHELAFGAPLPPLPRVDLPAWWRDTESGQVLRWDARTVAGLDERRRDRIRLGLPLDAELTEADILGGFGRAARRCQPHRFDGLGERERRLAERRLGRFEETRDRLLGVSA